MTNEIDFSEVIGKALRKDEENHEEHDEDTDDGRFHASSLGYCKRSILLSKQGVKVKDQEDLGRLMTGSLIHEFMENEASEFIPDDAQPEEPMPEIEQGGVTLVGTADVVDHENEVIYDFKTRANWYQFDRPIQRHIDQLQVYMEAFGFDKAKVVYISKSDMEVKTFPEEEGEFIDRDRSRFFELLAKVMDVYSYLQENGGVRSIEKVNELYKPCDNFWCGDEDVDFSKDPSIEVTKDEDDSQ